VISDADEDDASEDEPDTATRDINGHEQARGARPTNGAMTRRVQAPKPTKDASSAARRSSQAPSPPPHDSPRDSPPPAAQKSAAKAKKPSTRKKQKKKKRRLSFSQRISGSGEEDDDAEDDSDFSDGDNKRQATQQRGRTAAVDSDDEVEDSGSSDDEWPAKRKRKPPARAARTTARQRLLAPSPPLVQLPPTHSVVGTKRKRGQPTKLAPSPTAKVKTKPAAQSKRKPTSKNKQRQQTTDPSDDSDHSVPDLDDGPFDCVLDLSQRDELDSPPPLHAPAAKRQPSPKLSQLDAAAAVVGTLTAIDGDRSDDANDNEEGDEDVREVEAPIATQSHPGVPRSNSMATSSEDVRVPLFETGDGGFRQLRDRRPRLSYSAMDSAMPMASQAKRR
jgi:hypothetical protein